MSIEALVFLTLAAVAGLVLFPTAMLVNRVSLSAYKKFHMNNFISRVDEVMRLHLPGPNYQLFSSRLYATNNFYRQNSVNEKGEHFVIGSLGLNAHTINPQIPFDGPQKPVWQALLIEDRGWFGRKNLKMVVIDANDSQFFRKKLAQDQTTSQDEADRRDRKVAIYDIVNEMIVANGKNRLELEEWRQRPEFHEMLASAKLLSGAIRYSDPEFSYLDKKIDKVGKKAFSKFFDTLLLSMAPRHRKALKTERIGKKLSA